MTAVMAPTLTWDIQLWHWQLWAMWCTSDSHCVANARAVEMEQVAGGQPGLYQPSPALLPLIFMYTTTQRFQILQQAPLPSTTDNFLWTTATTAEQTVTPQATHLPSVF